MKTRHGTPGRGTLMRTTLIAAILIAASGLGPRAVVAQSKKIDLQTREGVAAVKGEWRYHDVKIVEVEGKGPDGKPNKTYNYEPRAFTADFDDTKWEVVAPETLKDPRSNGQICFCWYRIKITIPAEAAGKAVFFQTTADDYGEIWVDRRRRLQHGQPRRAQRSAARQGLSDCRLRHQRPDLGDSVQLVVPQEHVPRPGR
jgi:hypothetical protein